MSEANMAFGLAKILWAQQLEGLPLRACFIAGPDSTITRNTNRWLSGFGYGGKLVYDFAEPTVVLDVKPNACGTLVGGLSDAPPAEELTRRVQDLLAGASELEGVPLQWDFAVGNHFLDLFATHSFAGAQDLPPYVFIAHSSCPELRAPSAMGPGLYWDKSPELVAQAQVLETPWGPLRLLRGQKALDYYDFFKVAADFAARKRLLAAQVLFGDFKPLANVFHQGLLSPGEVLLGCHSTQWEEPLPLTLRPDLPSYLLRGLPNLSEEVMPRCLSSANVPDYVRQQVATADILPHGGGYALEGLRRLRRVWSADGRRFFELEREASDLTDLVTDPRDLPARYRGRQVLMLAVEWGLGEVIARLDPILVVKA
ncbi:MAG: hypothetical protein J7M26_07700 [Armatimonadetes bacterium]|nr:hypothetical protein [Armatimonadota bacterium]